MIYDHFTDRPPACLRGASPRRPMALRAAGHLPTFDGSRAAQPGLAQKEHVGGTIRA